MLKITQQSGAIGVNTKMAEMKIERSFGQLEIQPGSSQIMIDQQADRLEINWEETFKALGIYDAKAFSQKRVQDAHKKALEGINRYVQEGFMFADFHKHGVILTKVMANESVKEAPEIGMRLLPAPDMSYQPANVQIKPESEEAEIELNPTKIDVRAGFPEVQIYLQQEPSIDVQWTGNILDLVK